jgi:small subunit ribosomal protein S9
MAEISEVILKKPETESQIWGTGRRKSAAARVNIKPGTGKIEVNGKAPRDYFSRQAQIAKMLMPLKVTDRETRYDVLANVVGGGIGGQADAIRLGLARALEKAEPNLRGQLKRAGMLTRDARVKESKKYGQKRARKKFQFSKR